MKHNKIHPYTFVGLQKNYQDNLRVPTVNEIRRNILEKFNITKEDFESKGRKRHLVQARNAFCWIVRKKVKMSFSRIGSFIYRDHASVIHAIKMCKVDYDQLEGYRFLVNQVFNSLNLDQDVSEKANTEWLMEKISGKSTC